MTNHREVGKALQAILSREDIIIRKNIAVKYRFDALRPYRSYPGLHTRGYMPWFLVRPGTSREVAEILRVARRFRVPVVTYGAGTGLMGAAIALEGGIMVETSKMNRVGEPSREDMMFLVEPGVVLENAFEKLNREDLLFAHDPWTRPVATIGGAISTNSLGYLGTKYGSFGTQVLGLEGILPNGEVLKTRPAQFSSTGFDLRRLFIGTEGLFGIVTSATVRVFPKPETLKLVSYGFPGFKRAHQAISKMRLNDVRPSMIDYGEEPGSKEDSQLNLAFDGLEEEVAAHAKRADQLVADAGGHKLNDMKAREFWEHRHDVALMFSQRVREPLQQEPETKYDYINVSLPASKVLIFRESLLRIAQKGKVNVLEVGLWQGPELVSLVLSTRGKDPKSATTKLWRVSDRITRQAQDLGGAMEFCHGVGMKLAHLMKREHGVGLEVMRQFKATIDPLGIMNPGKQGLNPDSKP